MRVGYRELGSEAVNVVEVAVGLVLVLLLELVDVETLVVEARVDLLRGGRCSGLAGVGGSSFRMEGTASCSSLFGDGLGLSLLERRRSEVVGDLRSGPSSGRMGAHLDGGAWRGEDTLGLVDLVNVGVGSDAGITGDDFLGANVERRAHDGAFRRALGQRRERGEARGRRRRESAQSGGLGLSEERAGGLEAREGRKLVHGRGGKDCRNLDH